MFCVLCLTNTGFVQCYSLGSLKVCCTLKLVLYCALFSNFCFACFASQTSDLGSAFPSAPVKSVTRFCYALVRTLFCVFCLTNTGFVQCYSLGFRQVCCMLAFILLYSVIFCFTCFASPTSGLCSAFPFGSPQVYTLFFFVLFSLLFFMRALPNKLRPVVHRFFPGSPRICTLNFFALYYSVLILCSGPYSPSLI